MWIAKKGSSTSGADEHHSAGSLSIYAVCTSPAKHSAHSQPWSQRTRSMSTGAQDAVPTSDSPASYHAPVSKLYAQCVFDQWLRSSRNTLRVAFAT